MSTSFGALCTDFYVNQKIAVRMDLPCERETILHFFDRIRADQPTMNRFKRYNDELALESSRTQRAYRWIALRRDSLRAGHINPASLNEAYELHNLVLKQSPYNLSLSPLEIRYQEMMFGFDLEATANQHEIVSEALLARSPLAHLLDVPDSRPIDVQPLVGISLNRRCDLQAFFEVKTATTRSQVRAAQYRTEPISVLLTIRKLGPLNDVDDLLTNFATMRQHAEQLAEDRLVPHLLTPISRALTSSA